jgi:exosortase C (VPDSG-CTERM-specific)
LALLFARPLFDLTRFALQSDTFSHIILIPFIVAYLASLRWKTAVQLAKPSPRWATALALVGLLVVGANLVFARTLEVRISLWSFAYVIFVWAAGFQFLGAATLRQIAFPFALLVFLVPYPPVVMQGLEIFFQHASAFAAAVMMKISGLPAMQDGLFFFLPGLAIEVAQECSGIRSTLVLFITSLIAGYLLLRNPRQRAILAIAIIPLAILRNGFRIFSLAWLSVEVNPDIIHSPLHHRGGPIFFALSLIPLFLLLLFLRRLEKRHVHVS